MGFGTDIGTSRAELQRHCQRLTSVQAAQFRSRHPSTAYTASSPHMVEYLRKTWQIAWVTPFIHPPWLTGILANDDTSHRVSPSFKQSSALWGLLSVHSGSCFNLLWLLNHGYTIQRFCSYLGEKIWSTTQVGVEPNSLSFLLALWKVMAWSRRIHQFYVLYGLLQMHLGVQDIRSCRGSRPRTKSQQRYT
jgi:hypothetical protein